MAAFASVADVAKPVRGKPFVKGQSGNPGGADSLFKTYAAEFGDMTPVERVELRTAIKLMSCARRADANDAVRCLREAREWLDGIRNRRARKPEPVNAFDAYVQQRNGAER
jgi:hypothetical protein